MPATPDQAAPLLIRWHSWPIVDCPRWSWLVIVGIVAVAGAAAFASSSWPVAIVVAIVLPATVWQFFVPVGYEVSAAGLRCTTLGRTRLVPWLAIRAYAFRETGVVLYQRHDPRSIDLLRSMFVPLPCAAAEARLALRRYLTSAIELPA